MKKGSFFITLTKRLPSMDFTVLEFELYRMSWGEATIFIMQKNTDPHEPTTSSSNYDEENDEYGEQPGRQRARSDDVEEI